jgi:hypothetical protein
MSKKMISILVAVFGTLIAIWIWTFSSIGQSPIIIGGSTSANAFMQKVTTEISAVDYTYNSTGSQNGVNGVFNNVYTGGMISKDPTNFGKPDQEWSYYNEDGADVDITPNNLDGYIAAKTADKKSYTATQLGVDAIAIIYNLPGELDQPEVNFELSSDVLKDIYEGRITNWYDVPGFEKKWMWKLNRSHVKLGLGQELPSKKKLALPTPRNLMLPIRTEWCLIPSGEQKGQLVLFHCHLLIKSKETLTCMSLELMGFVFLMLMTMFKVVKNETQSVKNELNMNQKN